MLNWKPLLLSLSAFTLIGCGSQAEEVPDNSTGESETEESVSEEPQAESVRVENIDDGSSVEDEEMENESQELEEADGVTEDVEEEVTASSEDSPSEMDAATEAAEMSILREPQDGKDLNIVEAVAAADSSLPADTQFLLEPLSGTLYQIEARQDGADSSVSNLLGLYQYDMETGEVMKQDPTTGEFVPL